MRRTNEEDKMRGRTLQNLLSIERERGTYLPQGCYAKKQYICVPSVHTQETSYIGRFIKGW